ncbi:hypothetical protein [uncultured Nonlabens sp.]|jgi:hypothetical protein|uniref:hypothetical protein n=1 Tax=uncultured Nonlabens sp. TaxID=859306 RepID=UPI0030D96B2A|tara:strand:+ start:11749 stop:12057 length:309 start_codon:yes stop_codon:yes gene_type:complete
MSVSHDTIIQIEIDDSGKLHIKPEYEKFIMIYRTATEVHWNTENNTLYSPTPRDWTYLEWFEQIIKVVKEECSCDLYITEQTEWINIPNQLKKEIAKAQQWP